jgi:hypothetical protein
MKFMDVVTVVSVILNAGLLTAVFKLAYQWTTMKERSDILWIDYCKTHNIPFRPVGKNFEDRRNG